MRADGRGAWIFAGLLACVLAATAGNVWAAPDQARVVETIRRSIEQLRSTGEVTVAGRKLLAVTALPAVYEARGFEPLWRNDANEAALLGEIAAASGDGLDPADYHFDALRSALERRRQLPDDAAAAATADLLLTDALVRLAAHFYFGKLDPATGRPRWDLAETIRGESGAMLAARIAAGNAVALQLGELRPVQPLYGLLKSALARYRVIALQGGWPEIPAGRTLAPGMEDPRVALLRQRLAVSGDFPGPVVDSPGFDAGLEQALRRYQGRHRLEADGVLGPATLRSLNRPVADRIRQLRANLERARWLLSEVRGRFLLLDPAGGRVVLMENSRPVLQQDASFAAPVRTAAEFRAHMTYLVVHPDWILPSRLVEAQVAPLALREPAQLQARGLQVFKRSGEPVDAAQADWSRAAALVVRQLPDARSFLGVLRFPLPEVPHIFMHGGPAEGEALPGAIRLADPVALARALAGPPASWSVDDLAAALAADTPRTLPLGRPLPVLHASWSAWVDVDGTVSFRRGLEERDARINAGLARSAGGG